MLEPDIAKKCVAALIGVLAVVGISVFASWWMATPGTVSPPSVQSPVGSAPAIPSAPAPVTPPARPLAFRPVEPSPPPAPVAPEPSTLEDLERRAFQLEMDNARLRGRLDDMLAWILDNVRGTFPLPEHQMAHLRLDPVDEDMAVSADLAQLLRLTDEEILRLDAAFMGTRSVLLDIEADHIVVESPDPNQARLNIPPFSGEGQLVREALYDELVRTLGQARFHRFLQVAEDQLDRRFEYFGEADRTLLFEAFRDAFSGDEQLFVRDERAVPNRLDPLRVDIIASERIVSELPEEYYLYWNWLPEGITRYSRHP